MQNEAQLYLEQIERYDKFIQNKQVEIRQLRDLATSVTATVSDERVQTSGTSDKVGNITSLIVDNENELKAMIDHFFREKKERIELIERLENTLEYTVMHERYIQYMSLKDIAEKECYSYSYILTVHARGLKKIQNYLNTIHNNIEKYVEESV